MRLLSRRRLPIPLCTHTSPDGTKTTLYRHRGDHYLIVEGRGAPVRRELSHEEARREYELATRLGVMMAAWSA